MKKNSVFNGVIKYSCISMSLLLLGIILFLAGCSSDVESKTQDQNITTIKTVLKHQFTGPDQEFVEGLDNIEKLEQYYEERYKAYFTEEMFNKFISAHAYDYLLTAHNNGQQIKADTVSVEKDELTEGNYLFKLVVLHGEEESNQKSAEVSGKVIFNKEGKITSIKYLNDGGLSEELRN
jgi:PBP1b-binding outer membrane lipoprotein LpoB